MTVTTAGAAGPQISPDEADTVMGARERMLARHGLIEAMIANNALQLKNESARGGAEILRESARRDAAAPGAGALAAAEVEALDRRIAALGEERDRLVGAREWLNASLLEFEAPPDAARATSAGHA